MKQGYVNGSDLLLKVGGKAIGHCTSHTATFTSETKDRAVKPVATAPVTAGLWKDKSVVGLSISLSAEGLSFYDETEYGFADLLSAWKSGQPVTVEALERESDSNPYMEGSFVITSLEESAPAGDDTTYKAQFENNGEPTTLDSSKITSAA